MKTNVIEFIQFDTIRTPFECKESFEFREDRRYLWVQRVCFYLLRKIGAHRRGEKVTVERHRLDAKTFMERIFKQKDALQYEFSVSPKRLLIGAKDYADLMHEGMASQAFSFQAEYWKNKTVYGLTVTVIPWMEGVLVMPE